MMTKVFSIVVIMTSGCSTGVSEDPPDGGPPIDGASAAIDGAATPDGPPALVDAAGTGAVLRVFGDDYGDGVTYAPFGGSSNGPSIDGSAPHGGSTALRIEVPAAGYTGGAFKSATPVDLSGFDAVTFWAKASRAASLNVVGLGNDAAGTAYWAEWNAVPLTTTWTRHVVPIPVAAMLTAEPGLFHVAEGADEGTYTLWLDDIQYEVLEAGAVGPPSPAIATETVSRAVGQVFPINGAAVTYLIGGMNRTVASSRRYFTFESSTPAVATVDADGMVTAVAAGTTTITARLGNVAAIGALTFVVTP